MNIIKFCKCGFKTEIEQYKFCPICANELIKLEMEEDGTYKLLGKHVK